MNSARFPEHAQELFANKFVDVLIFPNYDRRMNFKPLLRDLAQVYTLESIKEMCGFASRGHVHDVMHGNQQGVKFELGMSIIDAHAQLVKQQKRKARK